MRLHLKGLVSFFVLVQILNISKCCVREEREALLAIKTSLHLDNDSRLSSWAIDSNSNCCTWKGVRCHPSSGHVVVLSLQDFYNSLIGPRSLDFSLLHNFRELKSLNLTSGGFGTLVHTQALANLTDLEVLVLKHNSFNATLPIRDLCGLKKIRVLDFSYNEFTGPLPNCLANLTSLEALDLSHNNLTGEIPASAISSLTSLQYLSLVDNYFEGFFPLSSFANNTHLKVLALEMSTNKFQVDTEDVPWVPLFQLEVLHLANCRVNMPQGTFPSFLLHQHELHYLDLSNNNLDGPFPNWLLHNNTNLRSLWMHYNSFTGSLELPRNIDQPHHPLVNLELSNNKMEGNLPKDISEIFPNLEFLDLSGNGLDGVISPSLGNMSKLFFLDMSRNNFSGEVPKPLWTGFVSLRYLMLSHNNLRGQPFPSPLNSSLEVIFLDNNYFNGTLEHGTMELPNLVLFDIAYNNFLGTIPSYISNISSLYSINLSGNNFTGTLPREFCELHLKHLHLSHNKLSGSIPECYLNLDSLVSLHLQSNTLFGSIPSLRYSISFLLSLDLRDNNLSGVIPDWIAREKYLKSLLLGGNKLQGQLPNLLCQLKHINFLDLSRNNFTGNVPACLYNASFGQHTHGIGDIVGISSSDSMYWYSNLHLLLTLNQHVYSFTDSGMEIQFRTKDLLLSYKGDLMGFMSGIDLSCNQLTGEIPLEIGSLTYLHALNLSHNHLNGSIPENFHKLENIESLDLSYNNLSGQIPLQLQDLNFLSIFNVSYNNLSGTVPMGGQFGAFDESSYKENPHLTLNNSNRGTTAFEPPQKMALTNDIKESVIDFISFIWSFSVSYVMVLLLLVIVLWINPYWRRRWFYFIETCLYRCLYPYLKDAFY